MNRLADWRLAYRVYDQFADDTQQFVALDAVNSAQTISLSLSEFRLHLPWNITYCIQEVWSGGPRHGQASRVCCCMWSSSGAFFCQWHRRSSQWMLPWPTMPNHYLVGYTNWQLPAKERISYKRALVTYEAQSRPWLSPYRLLSVIATSNSQSWRSFSALCFIVPFARRLASGYSV